MKDVQKVDHGAFFSSGDVALPLTTNGSLVAGPEGCGCGITVVFTSKAESISSTSLLASWKALSKSSRVFTCAFCCLVVLVGAWRISDNSCGDLFSGGSGGISVESVTVTASNGDVGHLLASFSVSLVMLVLAINASSCFLLFLSCSSASDGEVTFCGSNSFFLSGREWAPRGRRSANIWSLCSMNDTSSGGDWADQSDSPVDGGEYIVGEKMPLKLFAPIELESWGWVIICGGWISGINGGGATGGWGCTIIAGCCSGCGGDI